MDVNVGGLLGNLCVFLPFFETNFIHTIFKELCAMDVSVILHNARSMGTSSILIG